MTDSKCHNTEPPVNNIPILLIQPEVLKCHQMYVLLKLLCYKHSVTCCIILISLWNNKKLFSSLFSSDTCYSPCTKVHIPSEQFLVQTLLQNLLYENVGFLAASTNLSNLNWHLKHPSFNKIKKRGCNAMSSTIIG